MSFEDLSSLNWLQTNLPPPYSALDARCFICRSAEEGSALQNSFGNTIHAQGGALFQVVKEAKRVEESVPGVPIKLYRYEGPPEVQMWYVEKADLEEIMELGNFFGFPSPECAKDPEEAFEAGKLLVLELAEKKSLAIERIDGGFVSLRLMNPKDQLTQEDARQIREYNKRHFGAPLSKAEERDQLKNWIEKRFFTLGGI